MSPPTPVCSICAKQDAPSYFKISRLTPTGESPLTVTCSINCLLTWGYKYASMQGVKLAYGAKAALKEITDWFRVK